MFPTRQPVLKSRCSTSLYSPASLRTKFGGILGENDLIFLSSAARAATGVERRYRDVFRRSIFEAAGRALDELAAGTFDPAQFHFQGMVTDQARAAMEAGLKRPGHIPTKLSREKALQRIFVMWDAWRKGQLPGRQKKNAKTIRDVFLHTVQDFWKKNSEDFRRGDVYDQQAAKDAFAKRAKIVVSRADMIVATETTNYFNKARTEIYDATDGVTHYLFVAVRDKRTTKWCTSFQKGGRDGLVYPKGAAVTARETPACHWNCRSELLPLTPSNPRHLKLIKDARRARENNSPAPLPHGWKSR